MKRLLALLALVGTVAFGAPAWAEEKATPATPVAAASAEAPVTAATEAAAPAIKARHT